MAKQDISIKGLDTFSRQFLSAGGEAEYVSVAKGQQIKPEALKKYQQQRETEFITRAGSFCEDLIAFVVEQKKLRELSDIETVFGIALATIQLRIAYGQPQNAEEAKTMTPEKKAALLEEFDSICIGAQDFYDANA
jgi:hypothetical protein